MRLIMDRYDVLKDKRVLYAEDDDIANEFVTRILKKHCKEVISVMNGKEALEQFRQQRPDMVITDLAMPLMSGVELIKAIRQLSADEPILVITAFEDEVESIENKTNLAYITKPIDKKILLDGLLTLA